MDDQRSTSFFGEILQQVFPTKDLFSVSEMMPPPGAPPLNQPPSYEPLSVSSAPPPPGPPPPQGAPSQANTTGKIGGTSDSGVRPSLSLNNLNDPGSAVPVFSPIAHQSAQDGLPRPQKSPRVLVRPRAVNTDKHKKELAQVGKNIAINGVSDEPNSPLTPSKGLLEKRLTQFYQENCPGKIDEVQKISSAFEGKEDELNWHLFQKYRKSLHSPSGRRPPQYMPLQLHLVQFYKQFNPAMLQNREELDAVVKVYTGKEQELNERLQKKYNADLNSLII
jgi:hypothetical protein